MQYCLPIISVSFLSFVRLVLLVLLTFSFMFLKLDFLSAPICLINKNLPFFAILRECWTHQIFTHFFSMKYIKICTYYCIYLLLVKPLVFVEMRSYKVQTERELLMLNHDYLYKCICTCLTWISINSQLKHQIVFLRSRLQLSNCRPSLCCPSGFFVTAIEQKTIWATTMLFHTQVHP